MWTYLGTPDGGEARKLLEKIPRLLASMRQPMLEVCNKEMMVIKIGSRLLLAVSTTQLMTWIIGRESNDTISMPWYFRTSHFFKVNLGTKISGIHANLVLVLLSNPGHSTRHGWYISTSFRELYCWGKCCQCHVFLQSSKWHSNLWWSKALGWHHSWQMALEWVCFTHFFWPQFCFLSV